jgi:hypothetical protein
MFFFNKPRLLLNKYTIIIAVLFLNKEYLFSKIKSFSQDQSKMKKTKI